MRVFLIIGWLFVGLSALIFHFGPGKHYQKLDNVESSLTLAKADLQKQNWTLAVERLEHAMSILPKENITQQREIRLEKAKAQMLAQQLPEARRALQGLMDEVLEDENCDPQFIAETRSTLANSQYYMTWLMRLEGLSKDQWEPEIEAARQHYRLLSEQSSELGDCDVVQRSKEDLESAIRLARMDLSELQGLPLPSQ